MALEDERELVKAVKKKNSNVIKDLQKQLQSSNRWANLFSISCTRYTLLVLCVHQLCRRIENLEASISSEREPPATLPISRTSSHSSLDSVGPSTTPLPPAATSRHTHITQDTPLAMTTTNENMIAGAPATFPLSDEEVRYEL